MITNQQGQGCFLGFLKSQTQSCRDGQSLKMSQVSSVPTKEGTLLWWLEKWLGSRLIFLPVGGKMPVLWQGQKDSSNGAYWMRNSWESRKGAVASSLSEILETGSIAPRYYLTPTACRGILRRAEKRGKELPPQ